MRPIVVLLSLVFVAAGCAARHPASLTDRLVHQGEPSVRLGDPAGAPGAPAEEDSLATVMEKVRQLSVAMRPVESGTATRVEATNRELVDALARESAQPSAETHRAVGDIYMRLGVYDLAYGRFAQAIKADPRDAGSYEQLARVWRNWGFPHLGLGDAHRAVYYAPREPSGHNTLGTLLQALGQPKLALASYRRALALAPDAAYALNNVCSALLEMQDPDAALAACQRAVQLDPTLRVARRNLAIAIEGRGAAADPAIAGAAGDHQVAPGRPEAPSATQPPVAPREGSDDASTRPVITGSRPAGHARTSVTADADRR